MFYYIVILFVVVPAVELVLLNRLWDATGLPATLALVLATGFVGATLARMQGMNAWRKIHSSMAGGRTPGPELIDGVMILLAGAVLITPGIITDCLGFLFLIPQVRGRFGKWAVETFKKRTLAKFTVHTSGGTTSVQPESDPTVIDAEFTRVD
ncbi:MAG: FxsA family protein [Planctomycetaceae bacterium]